MSKLNSTKKNPSNIIYLFKQSLKKTRRAIRRKFRSIKRVFKNFANTLREKRVITKANYGLTFLCLLITIVIVIKLVVQIDTLLDTTKELNQLKQINAELVSEIESNTKKIAEGNHDGKEKYAEKKFLALLGENDFNKLISGYWSYSLLINENEVKGNNITVNSGDVKVSIVQKELSKVLPSLLHNKGMITGGDVSDNYYDHVMIDTNTDSNFSETKDNTVQTGTYYVKNVKAGSKFTITITEPLASRLHLNSTQIIISVQ